MKILLSVILAIGFSAMEQSKAGGSQQQTASDSAQAEKQPDRESLARKYETEVKTNPQSAEAWCNLGYALKDSLLMDEREQARKAFEEAIRLKPDYAEAYNGLAQAILPFSTCINGPRPSLKDYEESLGLHQRALLLKPDYADAYRGFGNACMHLKHYREAASAFEEAIRLDPGKNRDYSRLGQAYSELGLYQQALKCFEELTRRNNDFRLFEKEGTEFNEKRFYFYESLERAAALYAKLGHYQEALENYRQILKDDHGHWGTHYRMGLIYIALGDRDSAFAEYEAIMNIAEATSPDRVKDIIRNDADDLLSRIRN
ncbi:MAG: tetratricopeptide repeat protein [Acidobacteriota bacterium]